MNKNYDSIIGKWKIGNLPDEYNGKLTINKDAGVIQLELYLLDTKPIDQVGIKFLQKFDYLIGTLENGHDVTLLDSTYLGQGTSFTASTNDRNNYVTILRFSSEYIIDGLYYNSEDDIKFSDLYFELTNIFEWGGVSNFSNDSITDEFIIKNDFVNTKIYSDSHMDVNYSVGMSSLPFYPLSKNIEFNHTTVIHISSKEGRSIKWFREQLMPFKRLVEIATDNKVEIIKMDAIQYPKADESNRFQRPFKVLHCHSTNESEKNIHTYRLLFTLDDLIEKDIIKDYIAKYIKLMPVINLYSIVRQSNDLYLENIFLNTVQALETYHSRFICSNSYSEYKIRVENISNGQEGHIKFLLQENKSKKKEPHNIPFKLRMADLILAEFKNHFQPTTMNQLEFPQKIQDTRNYYTHYNKKYESKALKGQELLDECIFLMRLLRYYILLEIGFDSDFANKACRKIH